jgi:hypothetical protein
VDGHSGGEDSQRTSMNDSDKQKLYVGICDLFLLGPSKHLNRQILFAKNFSIDPIVTIFCQKVLQKPFYLSNSHILSALFLF